MATKKPTTKTYVNKAIHAVLLKTHEYEHHRTKIKSTLKKGSVFMPFDRGSNCYIIRKTNQLVVEHHHDQSAVFNPDEYKLVEVITTQVVTTTKETRPYTL